jgi:hypothetical protein
MVLLLWGFPSKALMAVMMSDLDVVSNPTLFQIILFERLSFCFKIGKGFVYTVNLILVCLLLIDDLSVKIQHILM